MQSSKIEVFLKGIDNQKIPDMVMLLKRPDPKQMAKWTPEQKEKAIKHLNWMKETFDAYLNAIMSA